MKLPAWVAVALIWGMFMIAAHAVDKINELPRIEPEQAVPTVPAKVEAWTRLAPELVPICSCESNGRKDGIPRQFNDDGTPLLGVINPSDIGMCQINRYYHEAEAIRLGLDLATEDGNVDFANILYGREGTKPWNWSKEVCWNK